MRAKFINEDIKDILKPKSFLFFTEPFLKNKWIYIKKIINHYGKYKQIFNK